MAVKKTSQEDIDRLKKYVSTSWTYFQENYKRYHDFRRYVFKESVNEQQKAVLRQRQMPIAEFNILESYVLRFLGEFSKNEPGISVNRAEGVPVSQEVINVVEDNFRNALHEADKNSFSDETMKDMVSGGFSVAKVWTDYSSNMSFNQNIYFGRAFDPTLCGFDPMARSPHKGDGRYSFEIIPFEHNDFKQEFPDADSSKISYTRNAEGFNWSYKDSSDNKIILVVDLFEKKKKKTRIVKLANGRSMTEKNYEKLQKYWEEQQFIAQIPAVVNKRWTDIEIICRYRFNEVEMLDYYETDYSYLPHVFFSGNSIELTIGTSNCTYQMTKPMVYQGRGLQDLMNFSGQSLAAYMESIRYGGNIIMKEAIPQEEDYLEAITNPQRATNIVVNAYSENNPDKPIPNPITPIVNVPIPGEVMGTFQSAANLMQSIMGSFSSALGKSTNDISGKAIVESAILDNAASAPYIEGYFAGLTQVANIYVDLMPKYIKGIRTIPVMSKKGESSHVDINSDNGVILDYDEKSLNVSLTAGVSLQTQKNQAVQQIISLMQASPKLADFFSDESGLKILTKNITIHGAENLDEAIDEWIEKQNNNQQMQMKQAQEMAMQNPQMIRAKAEMEKVELKKEQQQIENQIEIAKLQIEKELADAKVIESEAKVTQQQIDSSVRLEEAQTRQFNHSIDAATKIAEIKEREHNQEMGRHESERKNIELHHKLINNQGE